LSALLSLSALHRRGRDARGEDRFGWPKSRRGSSNRDTGPALRLCARELRRGGRASGVGRRPHSGTLGIVASDLSPRRSEGAALPGDRAACSDVLARCGQSLQTQAHPQFDGLKSQVLIELARRVAHKHM